MSAPETARKTFTASGTYGAADGYNRFLSRWSASGVGNAGSFTFKLYEGTDNTGHVILPKVKISPDVFAEDTDLNIVTNASSIYVEIVGATIEGVTLGGR